MFKNYMTTAFRVLIKNRLFSVINILGLAFSLAAFILIILYIYDEMTFETAIADHENIYRVEQIFHFPSRPSLRTASTSGPVMEPFNLEFAGDIEAATRYFFFQESVADDSRVFSEIIAYVDAPFFDVFEREFLEGDPQTALADVRSIILSETAARKYFGDASALGRTLTINGDMDFRISAVVRDWPRNSHFYGTGDMIALFDRSRWVDRPLVTEQWRSPNTFTYIKLSNGASPLALETRFQGFLDRHVVMPAGHRLQNVPGSEHLGLALRPITDIRLYADVLFDLAPPNQPAVTNTIGLVLAYAAIGLLIIISSGLNFINLSTARAATRAREIGLRKILGAPRKQLILQFLSEAIMTVFAAFLVGLAITELVLPWFNAVSGKALAISYTTSLLPYLTFVVVVLLIGGLSGFYPAMVMSSFQPSKTIRSNKSAQDSGSTLLRSVLTVFQYALSVGLIIAAIVIIEQTRFANNADVGFDPENILVLRLQTTEQQNQADLLRRAISNLPGVEAIGVGGAVPGDGYGSSTTVTITDENGAAEINLNYALGTPGFLAALDIEPLAGRLFSDDFATDQPFSIDDPVGQNPPAAIVSEAAARMLGYANPIDAVGEIVRQVSLARRDVRIVGVVPDVSWGSIREEVGPMIYFNRADYVANLTIRLAPETAPETIATIERLWSETLPATPIFRQFLTENLSAQYEQESDASNLFTGLTILAIVISSLGLFGLSAYATERRTKEIGIRKVLGASTLRILALLLAQFTRPVLIANIIAWPVTWYFMRDWLDGFAYRIELGFEIFLIAAVLAILIAWITVGGHAFRVARSNPIHALRYE